MATTTRPETGRPFARITEGRTSNSWRAAIPVVVALVAAIALLAYLASRLTSSSTMLAAAQRENEASQQSVAAAQKRAAQLETDSTMLKSAGRTTVTLESADKAEPAAKKGASAPAAAAAWAAATWGETAEGKSWLRVSAYGLQAPPEGKSYGVWFTPVSGEPVLTGRLDPAADGSAFVMAKDLPAVDQGKLVSVSLDQESAKAPGTALMSAQLPSLKVSKVTAAAPTAGPQDAAAAAPVGAAKADEMPATKDAPAKP